MIEFKTIKYFMKKFSFLKFLPLLMMVVFFSCKEESSVMLENTISLDQKEVVLNPGGTATLKAFLLQSKDGNRVMTGDDVSLVWESANDSIATVSDGVITAVTGGVVDIIVKSNGLDNVPEQRCKVTVRDVYVCGEYGTKDARNACVWKNDKIFQTLATDAEAYANAMVVTDAKDIYVAGNVAGEGKVWKNGAELYTFGTELKSIAVDGGNVYVGGVDGTTGKVWKNGEVILTADGAKINAVCVDAGIVFAAGVNGTAATIWKDGEATVLAENGEVNSLYIENGVVYAGGVVAGKAVVWESGKERIVLGDKTVINSLVKVNGDIYSCGYFTNNLSAVLAQLWINEEAQKVQAFDKDSKPIIVDYLKEFVIGKDADGKLVYSKANLGNKETVYATSIYNSLEDIYVAGYLNKTQTNAVYWKNGEPQRLEKDIYDESEIIFDGDYTPKNNRSRATAVVVK